MAKKEKNVFHSKEEMESAVVEIGHLQRQVAEYEAQYGEQINKLKTELNEKVTPLKERIKFLSEGVKFFMDRFRDKYITDEKKSLDLTVGTLGYRKTPPSVVIPKKSKENPDPILAVLEMNEMVHWWNAVVEKLRKVFLRAKLEIDKEAILKDPRLAFERTGIRVEDGKERFYIKPADVDLEVEV
ncbi:MAG: host-nuclease inhibitor Gam family protein [Leptospiraceae bacterium]|nr:host-nuclease inhibitor Gam family protein [Leptospiraceae bacterium]